jgi:hypothetical protein
MDGGVVAPAPPGTIPHPEHGTWEGHILPGTFFIIWASWWMYSNFRLYFKASAKRPYKSRSWYEFPGTCGRWPVEPVVKMLLPFIGMNLELWAGHVSYRRMYDPATGHFEQGNIQDWQHAAMYSAFLVSGVVDLIGFYTSPGTLPAGTEHGFLGLSLLIEGLLFAFHLKGTLLDMRVHLILVMVVFLAAAVCFAEVAKPHSIVVSTVRAQLVMLQGLWFYQIAAILFKDNPAWDPTTHGSVMMVPFFFVMWTMVVAFGTLLLFVVVAVYRQRQPAYHAVGRDEEGWGGANGHSSLPRTVELEATTSPHRN